MSYHMGRSFVGTRMEDDCPCPKAPCGLVLSDSAGDCPQHSPLAMKTIRQVHHADDCSGEAAQATVDYRNGEAA